MSRLRARSLIHGLMWSTECMTQICSVECQKAGASSALKGRWRWTARTTTHPPALMWALACASSRAARLVSAPLANSEQERPGMISAGVVEGGGRNHTFKLPFLNSGIIRCVKRWGTLVEKTTLVQVKIQPQTRFFTIAHEGSNTSARVLYEHQDYLTSFSTRCHVAVLTFINCSKNCYLFYTWRCDQSATTACYFIHFYLLVYSKRQDL